jgi:hypothetical protein
MLKEEKDVRAWGATHIPLLGWKRAFYADIRAFAEAVRADEQLRNQCDCNVCRNIRAKK